MKRNGYGLILAVLAVGAGIWFFKKKTTTIQPKAGPRIGGAPGSVGGKAITITRPPIFTRPVPKIISVKVTNGAIV